MQKYEWGDEKLESVPDLDAKLQYINKMSRIAKTGMITFPIITVLTFNDIYLDEIFFYLRA